MKAKNDLIRIYPESGIYLDLHSSHTGVLRQHDIRISAVLEVRDILKRSHLLHTINRFLTVFLAPLSQQQAWKD